MDNIFKQEDFLQKKRNRREKKRGFGMQRLHRVSCQCLAGTLANASIDEEYIIKAVETNNCEMKDFLFTLGCYEGETITLISILSDQYVIVIKDARYSIDKNLASCIII